LTQVIKGKIVTIKSVFSQFEKKSFHFEFSESLLQSKIKENLKDRNVDKMIKPMATIRFKKNNNCK